MPAQMFTNNNLIKIPLKIKMKSILKIKNLDGLQLKTAIPPKAINQTINKNRIFKTNQTNNLQ